MSRQAWLLVILFFFIAIKGYAVKVADLPEVNRADFIRIDGNDLFVADSKSFCIYVYSLETLKLKLQIGKRGEGPGEFQHPPQLNAVLPDTIWCSGGWKTLVFSRDGKLLQEKTFPPLQGLNITPIKNNFVAVDWNTDWQLRLTFKSVHLLNLKFEKIKEIYKVQSDTNFITPNDTGEEEFHVITHTFFFLINEDKIFIVDSKKGFFIDVFDANGNHLYAIDKKLEPVNVKEAQKPKILDSLYLNYKELTRIKKKSAFTFYDTYPPIRQAWIDNGKIYATTYKENKGTNEMIILDLKGNILKTIMIPIKSTKDYKVQGEFDTYTVNKNVLYEVIEDEQTGNWSLIKTDLSSIK